MADHDYTDFLLNALKTHSGYQWMARFFIDARTRLSSHSVDRNQILNEFKTAVMRSRPTTFLGTPISDDSVEWDRLFEECWQLTGQSGNITAPLSTASGTHSIARQHLESKVREARETGRPLDLQSMKLEGLDLTSIDLSGLQVSNARLQSADLSRANLEGAELATSWLDGANLSNSNMRQIEIIRCFFRQASIENADISKARVIYSEFDEANMNGCILLSTRLANNDMGHVDLADADLTGATLDNCMLEGADLSSSEIVGADISHCDLDSAKLDKANLQGARLVLTTARNSSFKYANLRRTFLAGSFTDCDFTGAQLRGAEVSKDSLKGSIMPDGSSLGFFTSVKRFTH